jgi:hypothetical protein
MRVVYADSAVHLCFTAHHLSVQFFFSSFSINDSDAGGAAFQDPDIDIHTV